MASFDTAFLLTQPSSTASSYAVDSCMTRPPATSEQHHTRILLACRQRIGQRSRQAAAVGFRTAAGWASIAPELGSGGERRRYKGAAAPAQSDRGPTEGSDRPRGRAHACKGRSADMPIRATTPMPPTRGLRRSTGSPTERQTGWAKVGVAAVRPILRALSAAARSRLAVVSSSLAAVKHLCRQRLEPA